MNTNLKKILSSLLKKEDVRKEEIIMKIIKLMDYFLKKDENLDLNITTYNILPICNEYGYIEFVNNLGVPSTKQILIKKNQNISTNEKIKRITFPCIIKPNNGGSSIGLSKVYKEVDLNDKIQIAFKEDKEVLIENFLDGQEVSVGVIQNKNERIILPITEIISDNELFDYNAKYLGESQEITPGNISDKSKKLIFKYLNMIYDNINLNGITRSEFIIIDEVPHILETNTIPGFTAQSIIPQQIKAANLDFKEIINLCLANTKN